MENELDKCAVVEGGETETAVPVAEQPEKKPLSKRNLKWALWSVAGLLAFVLVAVLTLPLWINPVATSLAKSLVPKYTGTAFDIQDVKLNPISGVKLANPEGYAEKDAFALGSLSADVEVSTLLSDTIHVREITIDSPFASYVFDAHGVNNFVRIMEAVNKKLGPKKKKKEGQGRDEGGDRQDHGQERPRRRRQRGVRARVAHVGGLRQGDARADRTLRRTASQPGGVP